MTANDHHDTSRSSALRDLISRTDWRVFGTLFVIALVAGAAALHRLGEQSLWFDEGYSVAITRLSWPALLEQVTGAGETNSAAYYVLLKAWSELGQSEMAFRSLSVFAAVGSVFVVFALGRKLWNQETGLWAAAFVASSALVIRQAQEARAYAWVMLLVAISVLLFVHAMDSGKRRYWLGFAIVSALAVYFHVLAAFMPAAFLVAWRWFPTVSTFRRVKEAGALWISLVMPFVIGNVRARQESWLSAPGPAEVLGFARAMAGVASERSTSIVVLVVALLVAVAIVRVFRSRPVDSRSQGAASLTLAWLVLPAALAFVVSHVLQPVFYPRYLIFCLPATALLAAYGVTQIPTRVRLVPGALLVVIGLYNIALDYGREPEDWRTATAFVSANAQPGDYVTFTEEMSRHPFVFYAAPNLDLAPDPFSLKLEGEAPEIEYVAMTPSERNRVWFVQSHSEHADIERSMLSQDRALVSTTQFPGIEVALYTR